jgi:hypothetical protein
MVTVLVICVALLLLIDYLIKQSLVDPMYFSGWVLMVLLILLSGLNVRKKLGMLPILDASWWLRGHIVLGFFACATVLVHVGFSVPLGYLDTLLWVCFLITAGSGILGFVISRRLPSRMHTEETLHSGESLPLRLHELAEKADRLMLQAIEETGSQTLQQLHVESIARFFSAESHVLNHLFSNRIPLLELEHEIVACQRYLDSKGSAYLQQLSQLAVQKEKLDSQLTLHFVLRFWLFLHVPLTFSLLILASLHLLLCYGFSMGAP